MGLKFFDFIKPKNGETHSVEVLIKEMLEAEQEFRIRELCLMICIDMIANAMSKCTVCTYQNHKEIKGPEYYMWNVEPNVNQNSSAFIHKWVLRLFEDGETLMIETQGRDGRSALVVADSFVTPELYPERQNEFKQVTVGSFTYNETFLEQDVIHLRLPHANVKTVIDGMFQSFCRLYDAAVKAYTWGQGKHMKVHVDQVTSGKDGWAAEFKSMLEDQVKPFLASNGAILPEFSGYKYEWFGTKDAGDTRDIRAIVDDIFNFTARALQIPVVLAAGKVEATGDANARFLTECIDPLCDQLQEEINRKRYGYVQWKAGNYVRVDSSNILHFDLFANAANVEKLAGSGAFTINDILKAANREPINEPWADQHYLTKNIGALQEMLNPVDS